MGSISNKFLVMGMRKSLFFVCFLVCSVSVFGQENYYNVNPGNGYGLRFWNSDAYKIHMGDASEYKYGPVTSHSIKMNMNATPGRGWTWGITGQTPIAALSNTGAMKIAKSLTTTGFVSTHNPNNSQASVSLSWFNDIARIRIGGINAGASNGFQVQGPGERDLFRIMGNGNVGIGTNSPIEKLQIGNAISFHDGGHDIIAFNYKYSGGGSSLDTNKFSSEIRFDPVNGNLSLGTASKKIYGPDTRMIITKTGNVGIGTAAPARLLELRQKEDPNSDNGLLITEPNNDQKIALHLANNASGQYGYLSLGGQTSLRGNGKPSYFEGFVGVGTTTSAGFKFAVNGKIRAKEIKVEANWADYVFEDAYNLPTLQQVENHIAEKGHLINIPSAAEVAENGIQLGEMNAKLLEKIEELTLYTIAQQKEIEELQEVKSKNEELEARLDKIEVLVKK